MVETIHKKELDVSKLMDHAIDWIIDNLDEFHPFKDERGWDIKNAQRVTELAILLICLKEVASYQDPRLTKILNMLSDIQNHPRFRDRVLRMPEEFVLYSDLYAVLARMGRDDPWQREVLQRAISQGLLHQVERFPHRIMDVSLSLEMAGLEADWPTVDEVYKDSILGQKLDPHYLRESALYAITHVIMFKWGFGLRYKAQIKDKEELRRLADLLSVLLIDCCLQKHWDLVSELLICWDCIKFHHSYVYSIAWSTLASMQTESGAFPGPERAIRFRKVAPSSPEEEAKLRSSFEHCYHTTLTTIMAGALRLRSSNQSMVDIYQRGIKEEQQTNKLESELKFRVECMERARKFLMNDLKDLADGDIWQKERAAQDIVGIWICESTLGKSSEFEKALNILAMMKRDTEKSRSTSNLSRFPDFNILVLAGLIATASGVSIPEFKRVTAAIIKSLNDKTLNDPCLLTIHSILSHLGLVKMLPPLKDEQMLKYLNQFDIKYPQNNLMEFVSIAEAYSLVKDRSSQIQSAVIEVLQGMVVHMLREYHLIKGMCVIRSLNYLVYSSNKIRKLAYRFLCNQQQATGSFGFLGPELSIMKSLNNSKDRGWNAKVEETLMVAKITNHAIWTLAESLGNGWRIETAFKAWCEEST